MNNSLKRILCGLFALIMVFTVVIEFIPTYTYAASGTGYTQASDVKYVKSGNYVYNWGAREEDATFLSTYAVSFYTGSYTFDTLSELSGGTGTGNAPSSSLYKTLQTLMKSKHTYQTNYDATKDLYRYTDCELSNRSRISSFYSGKSMGSSWGNGWNREHTWPNSKGLNGKDETDIMMLRPTSESENGSRGNTAYGKSSGYYNPNRESNGQYDLRGDVARIFLYVYVRWGNTNGNGKYTTWGTSGVMESLDVLLEWMEADPVDTWEMGRNDAVQSITGTRNVFIDYPEYAWLLFGRSVPKNMVTPSGEASDGVQGGGSNGGNGGTLPPDPTPDKNDVITDPAVNIPYKFGMVQGNLGQTLYLTGKMDTKNSFYMATTTDKDASIDVYLQSTNGGYYLYALINGTKAYINAREVEGTDGKQHINGFFESSPKSVYTFDSTHKTLVTRINGSSYAFGTRSDNSYSTVGPCDLSKPSFLCQLYASNTTSAPDGTDPTPTPTPTPTPSVNKNTFVSLVSELNGLAGKELYSKISEAATVYGKLTEGEKNEVASSYKTLTDAANAYNESASSVNNDASVFSLTDTAASAISVAALQFALYQLFGKKYI